LSRLFGARSTTTAQEKLGYCTGGYKTILGQLEGRLRDLGTTIRIATPVTAIRPAGARCELSWRMPSTDETATFDQVFFTGPTRLARKVAADDYHAQLERTERTYPTSAQYLGVACLVLVLPRALTPYYVTNIGDDRVRLTGVIEMTNLIDRQTETKGLSLLYLPQYMDSEDRRLVEPGDAIADEMIEQGVKRLLPDFDRKELIYARVHRARFVQPLPLVRLGASRPAEVTLERPFQVLNTSMLTCATLNNNEVVGFVNRFDAVCASGLS
jgi:protoporphyrinogen oxidase